MSDAVLVIIPTYNERDNVTAIASEVHRHLPEAHILFVDDNSPDGTGRAIDDLAAVHPWVKTLHREAKAGLGTAYLAGFRRGLEEGYDYLIEMDADFSHDPRYLPELLRLARDRADVVVGSRYVDGGGTQNWGLARRLLSRGGSLYARTVLGIPIRDLTAGFMCWRRRALEKIDLTAVRSEGYGFQIEMKYRALRAGSHVLEVPILFVDRRVGESKMSRGIVLEALGVVWKLRFSASARASLR